MQNREEKLRVGNLKHILALLQCLAQFCSKSSSLNATRQMCKL